MILILGNLYWIFEKNLTCMHKKKYVGALLNLLMPGLGTAYARKYSQAVFIYLAFVLLVVSARFISYSFPLFASVIAAIIVYYVFVVVKGFRDIDRNQVYEKKAYDAWYVYLLILLGVNGALRLVPRPWIDEISMINFFNIPTPSMQPTLMVGDKVAVLKGQSAERNAVTVFINPQLGGYYVHRCVAVPGDSMSIVDQVVVVNNQPEPARTLNFAYQVNTKGGTITQRVLDNLKISREELLQNGDQYRIITSKDVIEKLRSFPFVKSIDKEVEEQGVFDPSVYPQAPQFSWNTDFYGKLYLPKKGDRIRLNADNVALYGRCILFENKGARIDNSTVYINNQPIETYEFKQGYYFMMGDSRHNALDSRYWGLVPEELIYGKALYVYFGEDPNRIGYSVD